jgi:hypothetical protein
VQRSEKILYIVCMSSQSTAQGTVLTMQAALPSCTATLTRCIKNWNERGSLVAAAMRWPQGHGKTQGLRLLAHPVFLLLQVQSSNCADSDEYFSDFQFSASLAAAPGLVTALFRWLSAVVSGQVKSHTMHRPLAYGSTVRPSRHFPSSRQEMMQSFTSC